MLIAKPVLGEGGQAKHMTSEGVEVVAREKAQGGVLVFPEAGVEVDEGEDHGGEGQDGLNSSHRVQQVAYQATDQKNFPHLRKIPF